MERILVMNLGSTSSKIAVYEDTKEIFTETLRHTQEEMAQFDGVLDQFDFRNGKIREALEKHDIPAESITVACSRGGNICACPHGAIGIDQNMVDYLTRPDDLYPHASLLGSLVAYDFHNAYGSLACIYDAIGTDEMIPIARVSGVPAIPRFTVGHTLNTRAMAIKCAEEKLGKKFEDCTFIVAHLGGGSSVRLYQKGINVDCVNDDEGNFTPERGGGVPAKELIALCYSGKYASAKEATKMLMHGNGGLKAHLGTTDAIAVEKMIEEGDEYAKIVYEAMAYGVGKDIGKLAAAAHGKVDAIILTGGISYSKFIANYIKDMVDWIAPVEIMAGEYEMEALAAGALRVAKGEEELQDFQAILEASQDRISIIPGLEPGTVPAR